LTFDADQSIVAQHLCGSSTWSSVVIWHNKAAESSKIVGWCLSVFLWGSSAWLHLKLLDKSGCMA